MPPILTAFSRGSSPVDWCEGNYLVSPVIAEYVNTYSNILFFIYPPILMILCRKYAELVNRGIYLVWGIMLTVGINSAYFHATLSFVGQLLDELSILWVLMAAYVLWVPNRYTSFCFKKRNHYQMAVFVLGVVLSLSACIHPIVNAFAGFALGLPILFVLFAQIRNCKDQRVVNLGHRTKCLVFAAIICWFSDHFFCEVWSKIHFPYLHSAWHIFVAISGFSMCIVGAYFEACNTVPEQLPVLSFWPSDDFELGVPYIRFKKGHKSKDIKA